jgi:prepilin-type N-terminal cleavage/methylation domain-containing protein
MKGRSVLRRRRAARGFTLMELMVVVMLVAILAMIATPSMTEARNDRIAFDYASRYQQLLVKARARAAGTGSAHLVLFAPGTGGRGYARVYAALDGGTSPGPAPVSSCKETGQWAQALVDPPSVTAASARLIDFVDLNRPGINDDMDLRATPRLGAANPPDPVTALAVCITPAGVTYIGGGPDATDAINNMRKAAPFSGLAEVWIEKYHGGSEHVGLRRRIIMTGGGAPRLRSE